MTKDTRTAWGQEFDAKQEAWRNINELKAELTKVTAERDEYIKFHTENLPLIASIARETVNVNIDGDIKARFDFYLAKRDLENTRKGFWLGFEDARCHPSEMNILNQWESTLTFKQANKLTSTSKDKGEALWN